MHVMRQILRAMLSAVSQIVDFLYCFAIIAA